MLKYAKDATNFKLYDLPEEADVVSPQGFCQIYQSMLSTLAERGGRIGLLICSEETKINKKGNIPRETGLKTGHKL